MNKVIITAGFVFLMNFLMAQNKVVAVSSGKGLVIEHTVAAGEGLYSLARKYNVPVGDLAAANDYDKNKSLNLGQTIKVPLLAANLNQQSKKGVPVYYTVGEKEGLMTVSNKFNKVTLKNLRAWNGLKKDVLAPGQSLIVGYLSQPETAAKETTKEAAPPAVVKEEKKPAAVKKEEQPAVNEKKPETASKEDTKVEQLVAEKIAAKQETEAAKDEPLDATGYFKKAYNAQTNAALATEKSYTSGIFKTNKGWNDAKYYLLMDNVAAGTVVKIQNPANQAIVYAKVLGEMSGIKLNNDLQVRISDAAASALKLTELEKFTVNVTY